MNSVAQRESLLHIISEINIAKAELHAQSQSAEITEQVNAEAAVRLNNAEEVVNSLSDHLASLSGRMSEVQLELGAERSAKVQFQLLLSTHWHFLQAVPRTGSFLLRQESLKPSEIR